MRVQDVTQNITEAFSDRLRRHLGPFPHPDGKTCHCWYCLIKSLTDDDLFWFEAHGWRPPRTEIVVQDYGEKPTPPCVLVALTAQAWRDYTFQTGVYGELTIAATYIPRPGNNWMDIKEWFGFERTVSSMLIGDCDDDLAKFGGCHSMKTSSLYGPSGTLTTQWSVFLDQP